MYITTLLCVCVCVCVTHESISCWKLNAYDDEDDDDDLEDRIRLDWIGIKQIRNQKNKERNVLGRDNSKRRRRRRSLNLFMQQVNLIRTATRLRLPINQFWLASLSSLLRLFFVSASLPELDNYSDYIHVSIYKANKKGKRKEKPSILPIQSSCFDLWNACFTVCSRQQQPCPIIWRVRLIQEEKDKRKTREGTGNVCRSCHWRLVNSNVSICLSVSVCRRNENRIIPFPLDSTRLLFISFFFLKYFSSWILNNAMHPRKENKQGMSLPLSS